MDYNNTQQFPVFMMIIDYAANSNATSGTLQGGLGYLMNEHAGRKLEAIYAHPQQSMNLYDTSPPSSMLQCYKFHLMISIFFN